MRDSDTSLVVDKTIANSIDYIVGSSDDEDCRPISQ